MQSKVEKHAVAIQKSCIIVVMYHEKFPESAGPS